MATWSDFVRLVTGSVGAKNVVEGAADSPTMVVILEATRKDKDGNEVKRSQKLRFEYDGKDVNWIAVTSFIGDASADEGDEADNDAAIRAFLEILGKDWKDMGAVIVDGHVALRHHISLIGAEGGQDANERVLLDAFRASARVASLADYYEKHIMQADDM